MNIWLAEIWRTWRACLRRPGYLLLAAGVLRVVMDQLDRHGAFDPLIVVGVCVVLTLAGLLACLLPALRAARVQPMRALRGE